MTMKGNWVFGYGSLINTASRNRTFDCGYAIACHLRGFSRRLNLNRLQGPNLGIVRTTSEDETVNGVLFEVSSKNLELFDARELKWGYERVRVEVERVSFCKMQPYRSPTDFSENVILWTYVLNELHQEQTGQHLLSQTYLDNCIMGCLEYGRSFANDFLRTTKYIKKLQIKYDRLDKLTNSKKNYSRYSDEQWQMIDDIITTAIPRNGVL